MERVTLKAGDPGPVTALALDMAPGSVAEALDFAQAAAPLRPFVGQGATIDVWEALATLAASDLGVARAVEPHLDALTILDQAGLTHVRGGTWGVFAAEAPGHRVEATPTATGWRLSGTKAWCSLAGSLTDALVTAWVSETDRQLFHVRLSQAEVEVSGGPWHSLGLAEIPSGDVAFHDAPGRPIGEAGWYLDRAGFAWGGISVAACWFGGAVGVGRALLAASREPSRHDDDLMLVHLGSVDEKLAAARTAFESAARSLDGGSAEGSRGNLLAKRVRSTTARAAEGILVEVGHALGPAPLANDPVHAKRIADLQIYVRQHHASRDDLSLGRSVRDAGGSW